MKTNSLMIVLVCLIITSCGKTQTNISELTGTPPFVTTSTAIHTTPTNVELTPSIIPTKDNQSMNDDEFIYSTHTPMPSQECQEISIEDYSSLQGVQGIIPLIGITYKFEDSYLLNLETKQKLSIPDAQVEYFYTDSEAASPDGKWFAYLPDTEFEKQILMIVNSQGALEKTIDLTSIIEPVYRVLIGEWIDNERILLIWANNNAYGVLSSAEAITVILNPFSGELTQYKSDYPDIFTIYPDFGYSWEKFSYSLSVYNQPLDRVLYLSRDGIVVWDLLNQVQLKLFPETPQDSVSQPVWSHDGSKFVVDLDTEDGRNLFLISKDGNDKQITFMTGYETKEFSNFSWSPDNNSITFWLYHSFEKVNTTYNYYYHLNILDINSQKIRTYCINAYNWGNDKPSWYPIWSPDGKYLVVAVQNETDLSRSMTVLVDLVNERAYKLADDVIPVGWMVSE